MDKLKVTMFYKSYCAYSIQAYKLIHDHFSVHNILTECVDDPNHWTFIRQQLRTKLRVHAITLPVIFLGHKYLGGCAELIEFLHNGHLDEPMR
jgi:glutaredoxin